jgi:hypothetical protein
MTIKFSGLKALWSWLTEARYALICILIIVIASLKSFRHGASEPFIRMTGLTLQLFGILTVIWGIKVTRDFFKLPSFMSKLKDWLSRFPLLRRQIILGVSSSGLLTSSGKARAFVTHTAGPNPTIEARVEALEKNVTSINERISQTQNELDGEIHQLLNSLKGEEQSRQSEDSTIRSMLEAIETGGIHITAIGASWLFFGLILSTAAIEISRLYK